jgi:hypothetical protein
MTPKPFGKPVHHGRTLTKGLRFTIALWGAAVPAYFLCKYATKSYATLGDSPFFWPSALGFVLFYAVTLALWLRKKISPRAPGTSSRTGLFVSRFLLALLIAFPTGLISALLYEPAFILANGLGSMGGRTVEHAMVDKVGSKWYLDAPYWQNNFRWEIKDVSRIPSDLVVGSLAKVTFRTGLLGARRIESIEYTVLK